jgi:hypothetical protein
MLIVEAVLSVPAQYVRGDLRDVLFSCLASLRYRELGIGKME